MTTPEAHTVSWEEGDQKPANPRTMSKARRWLIVVIVSSGSLCVACASSLYASAEENLQIEFGCSRQVATLGLSLFVFGLGLGPMILAPLSEFYGRRPIYVCSFSLFVVWLLPCAVAQNMPTMLVGRFFDGFAGSAFLSVAGGTVSDLFSGHELSAPMMVYTASPFLGPELGPLIGGFINQYCPWRWSFYFLLIWGGIELVLILVFVPETHHPILLCQKARRIRLETGDNRWKAPMEPDPKRIAYAVLDSCKRPFQLLIFEPMCLNLCILSAILLGILYLFFGAFPLIFSTSHNFTLSQSGLSFLGLLVGMIFGIISDPIWSNHYQCLVRRRNAESEEVDSRADPEFRLLPSIVGSVIIPVAIFGFGWTTYSSIHWIVPIIFSSFFGMGYVILAAAHGKQRGNHHELITPSVHHAQKNHFSILRNFYISCGLLSDACCFCSGSKQFRPIELCRSLPIIWIPNVPRHRTSVGYVCIGIFGSGHVALSLYLLCFWKAIEKEQQVFSQISLLRWKS